MTDKNMTGASEAKFVRVDELFREASEYPEDFGIVMPLTTGFSIEKPEDVIGFAWRTVKDDLVKVLTFPGRDWESTAMYTGMTKDMYEDNLIDSISDHTSFSEVVKSPVVAYASGILINALKVMDRRSLVIDISRALAKLDVAFFNPGNLSTKKIVDWLNSGVPLRKLKRKDTMKNYGLRQDDRSGVPIIGQNLEMDAKLFQKILESKVALVDEEEEDIL